MFGKEQVAETNNTHIFPKDSNFKRFICLPTEEIVAHLIVELTPSLKVVNTSFAWSSILPPEDGGDPWMTKLPFASVTNWNEGELIYFLGKLEPNSEEDEDGDEQQRQAQSICT